MGIVPGHISVVTLQRPSGDIALEAWHTSRPNEIGATKQAIMNIDVPVNELEDFVLVMHVPVIVRDLVFTLRDHVAWARTSRADDITHWEIYHSVAQKFEIKELYDEMMSRKNLGWPQDKFRSLIPLSYMTEFTIKLSARSLIRFMSGVEALFHKVNEQEVHILNMLNEFHRELHKCFRNSVYGSISQYAYGVHDILPYKPMLKKDYAMMNGPFIQLGFKAMPFMLRAQLVRHRPIQFVDDFFDLLVDDGLLTPMECNLQIEMMMTIGMAQSLIVKRNCWIAQADIWQQVVKPLNNLLGDNGTDAPLLPCSGKLHCPVGKDNQLRFENKDPAPPCPLWCGMSNINTQNADLKLEMLKYADDRGPLAEWWMDQVFNFIPDQGA